MLLAIISLEIWIIFSYFRSSPEYRVQTEYRQTDEKRCIRAHRASCTGGLKNQCFWASCISGTLKYTCVTFKLKFSPKAKISKMCPSYLFQSIPTPYAISSIWNKSKVDHITNIPNVLLQMLIWTFWNVYILHSNGWPGNILVTLFLGISYFSCTTPFAGALFGVI